MALRLTRPLALVGVLALAGPSCVGAGEGEISGPVNIPICHLSGIFDLHPSFFAANRDGASMTIRIQNGGGQADYSDNLWITIDDTDQVAQRIASSTDHDAQGNPVATFPVGMRGAPGVIVHATFSPDWACGRRKSTRLGQNVGLWAYDGSITFRAIDNPQPDNPGPRFTDVTAMHLLLHDPRPVGPGAPDNIPASTPVGDAELNGHFSFHYSRQVPAQMFP